MGRLDGIEKRVDAKGVTRYRGVGRVYGARRHGKWTTDLEEAIAWRDELLRDASFGLLSHRAMTLGEAIDEFTAGIREGWIRNKTGRPYRASVVRLYTRCLTSARRELGPKTVLDELRLPHVDRFADRLRRSGATDSEVHNRITALRALYVWALRVGHARINPCAGLPLPVGDSRPKQIATAEQCSLLTACLVGRDRSAFALAWQAGLRAGELLALAWEDVELDERTLYVRNAVDTTTREWGDPKTYAGKRRLPIRSQLLAVLEDHAAEYGAMGLLFPAYRAGGEQTRARTPMSYSGLVQRLSARWRAAGLAPMQLHAARHTFVSMLIDAGTSPKRVMEYAGHSSIAVTYNVYGHLFPSDIETMLKLLDEYDEEQR